MVAFILCVGAMAILFLSLVLFVCFLVQVVTFEALVSLFDSRFLVSIWILLSACPGFCVVLAMVSVCLGVFGFPDLIFSALFCLMHLFFASLRGKACTSPADSPLAGVSFFSPIGSLESCFAVVEFPRGVTYV